MNVEVDGNSETKQHMEIWHYILRKYHWQSLTFEPGGVRLIGQNATLHCSQFTV